MQTRIGFLGEFNDSQQEQEFLEITWLKDRVYTLSAYFICCFLLLWAGIFADYQREYAVGSADVLTILRVGLVLYGAIFFFRWKKKDYSKMLEVHFTLIKFYSVFIVALMTIMTLGTSKTLLAGIMIMTISFYVMLPGHLKGSIFNCLLLLILFISLPLMNDLGGKQHFYQCFMLVSLNIVLLYFRVMFNKAWRLFYISNYQLEGINKAKDDVLYTIAHDLKSPLQVIMTTAQLVSIRSSTLSTNEIERYQERILMAAEKTDHLLSDLLSWALASNDSMGFSPSKRNIQETVGDAVEFAKDLAKVKSIKLEFDVQKCEVEHDRYMIETCLRNLLTNAIKFTPSGKKITIFGKADKEYTLSIVDEGIGIPQVIIEGIKNGESFHAEKGTNGEAGSGIGLKLVHSFMQKHKGRIEVVNQDEGGSCVSLILPL